MNIQRLSIRLGQLISDIYREKRNISMGISPISSINQSNKILDLIHSTILEPIVKDLCENNNHEITYQHGTSIGFYYLLINNNKFTVIYVPNLTSGIVFIKYLNRLGKQCTTPVRLTDTSQILEYLKGFLR